MQAEDASCNRPGNIILIASTISSRIQKPYLFVQKVRQSVRKGYEDCISVDCAEHGEGKEVWKLEVEKSSWRGRRIWGQHQSCAHVEIIHVIFVVIIIAIRIGCFGVKFRQHPLAVISIVHCCLLEYCSQICRTTL